MDDAYYKCQVDFANNCNTVNMKGAGWVQRENYCQGTFRNENRYGILTSGDFP